MTGGTRDAPERQRTLEATIAWSYDLLDDPSKALFARLSVFAGSFPIDLAETVCEAELETLATLVDSSLLKPIDDDRFLLLETIREYALGRLLESGIAEDVRQRHAAAFAALAEAGTNTASRPRPNGRIVSSEITRTSGLLSTGWQSTMPMQSSDSRVRSAGSGFPTRTLSRAGAGSRTPWLPPSSRDAFVRAL